MPANNPTAASTPTTTAADDDTINTGTNDEPVVGSRDKTVPWYDEVLENLSPQTRALLEGYSGIASDEVLNHVYRVRDQAWEIFPYPCIGGFRFLDLAIGSHPLYPELLSRLTSPSANPQTYLDLGCCFGQDIRRLVADGVPASSLYGSDLQAGFIELGYELFLDAGTLRATFVAADVFDESVASPLSALEGKLDVVHSSSFFHLFDYEQQKAIARRVVRLLKPRKGSLLVGRQVGNVEAGEKEHGTGGGGKVFRHDGHTWRKMWEEVGAETGTRWEVEAELREWDGVRVGGKRWNVEGTGRLVFSVRRL